MNPDRKKAYLALLATGMLHVKWDLACWHGGLSWLSPRHAWRQLRAAQVAAARSVAFHNLAIFSVRDFSEFREHEFWRDLDWLRNKHPDGIRADYRDLFERYLRGERIEIIRPAG